MFISCCSIIVKFVSFYHLKYPFGTGNEQKEQKKWRNLLFEEQISPFYIKLFINVFANSVLA